MEKTQQTQTQKIPPKQPKTGGKKKQLKCEGIKPYHVLEMITVVDKHQILHIQAP
jgi:hypothetical protein